VICYELDGDEDEMLRETKQAGMAGGESVRITSERAIYDLSTYICGSLSYFECSTLHPNQKIKIQRHHMHQWGVAPRIVEYKDSSRTTVEQT
jgi:hypothetical protein